MDDSFNAIENIIINPMDTYKYAYNICVRFVSFLTNKNINKTKNQKNVKHKRM